MIAALKSVIGAALIAALVGALADPRDYVEALRTLIPMALVVTACGIF